MPPRREPIDNVKHEVLGVLFVFAMGTIFGALVMWGFHMDKIDALKRDAVKHGHAVYTLDLDTGVMTWDWKSLHSPAGTASSSTNRIRTESQDSAEPVPRTEASPRSMMTTGVEDLQPPRIVIPDCSGDSVTMYGGTTE